MFDVGRLPRAGDLFQLLRDGKARTRAELALSTGLARSTVASHIDALMQSGLVGTAGESASSGGRPPSCFAFKPAARVLLAVDIGISHVDVVVADLCGQVLVRRRLHKRAADGPEMVLNAVNITGRELLAGERDSGGELAGIGVGLPGPVELGTGTPGKSATMPGWEGFDVVGYVQRSLPVPVLVDNNVNLMALGEWSAHWPGHDNFLLVNVARGIGCGIISGGQLQHGANGTSGSLGHVRMPCGEEILCDCGNYGCLDALASVPAIARKLRGNGLNASTEADVLQLLASGNVRAIHALRQAGQDIGDVLSTVVNLLNPSVVAIGGTLGDSAVQLVAGIREVVYQRSLPLATAQLQIGPALAGDKAAVLGASQLVIRHVLSPAAIDATLQLAG